MPHTLPTLATLFGPQDHIGMQRTKDGVTEVIVDIVDDATRTANAKQAITQMFDGNGKATGSYTYGGLPIWHASAGKPDRSSVSLFYTMQGTVAQVVAIGEHVTSKSYSLCDWGRTSGPFKKGAKISLTA